jgi:hypothetical protein
MNLKDRMARIDVNLDDLQSGLEASSRASDALHKDTTKFDGQLNPSLRRSVLGHVKDLLTCTRDQREALQELREGIARLEQDLNGTLRPLRRTVVNGRRSR